MDEDLEGTDNESAIIVNTADVENTVAFSLISEAEKLNQVFWQEQSVHPFNALKAFL